MKEDSYHEPVLVHEVVEGLHIDNRALIIDATVGTGGHALAITKGGAKVLGIDADRQMLEIAESRLKDTDTILVQGNFRDIDEIAAEKGWAPADGILFDLGVSNLQLTSPGRGFSFGNPEAPLDMRIDKASQGLTAADLLNALREDQLRWLFEKVLWRVEARKIAKEIIRFREFSKFRTVGDFLQVCRVLKPRKPGLNPATLAFLGLRLAVNSELENLEEALAKALFLLKKGKRLLVITFHSGEQKVVLGFFRRVQREGRGKILTKDPILPRQEEIARNPRARSAKLYILEKW